MDVYQYRGRNKRGDIMQGTIESPNTEGVVNWMITSGIAPIDIRLKTDPLKNQPNWLRTLQGAGRLSAKDLLLLTRQMATLMKAGVPMIQAINGLKNSSQNPSMTDLLRSIHASLSNGAELSTAMARHPKIFDDYYVNMVRVGETAGKLDEVFDRLFIQLDFDRRMRQKIKTVLRYPTFVFSAIIVAILVLMIYVIPVFSKVYSGMQMTLPGITVFLITISEFTAKYWWAVLGSIMLAFFLVRRYLSTTQGRYQWDKLKLRIPVIGKVLAKATTARLCRSFGTAMKSGVPVVTALALVSKVVDNAFYEERILVIRDAVSQGDSLLRSFLAAGIFTPVELQMVAVGEETGDIEGVVQQLATLYQDEVEYEANQLGETLEPILLVFMAVLVTILLLGIFLPMWNLTQMTQMLR